MSFSTAAPVGAIAGGVVAAIVVVALVATAIAVILGISWRRKKLCWKQRRNDPQNPEAPGSIPESSGSIPLEDRDGRMRNGRTESGESCASCCMSSAH